MWYGVVVCLCLNSMQFNVPHEPWLNFRIPKLIHNSGEIVSPLFRYIYNIEWNVVIWKKKRV